MLAELSATSADVVNGSQLYNTNQQVALNTSGLAEIGNNISTLQQDTLLWYPSLGAFSAKHGPTLSNKITNVAERNNTVSNGSDDNQRQITNVVAGTEDTDAVKIAQLKSITNSVNTVNTDISQH